MLSLPLLKFPVLFDSSWREQQRVPEVAPGAAFPGFPHSQGTRGSSAPSQLIPKEVLGSLPAHRTSPGNFPSLFSSPWHRQLHPLGRTDGLDSLRKFQRRFQVIFLLNYLLKFFIPFPKSLLKSSFIFLLL